MHLIRRYLQKFRRLFILCLVLAAINQIFSLLDPQIFRIIIDKYIINAAQLPREVFIRGVALYLLAIVGVAMVSRIAKNFQDYYVNSMVQKVGMQIYQASIRHIFDLPYKVFEDQQSGQLLQKLHDARTSIQNFISSMINTVFLSLVGITFVMIYAFITHRVVGVLYAALLPIMGFSMFFMSRRIKKAQNRIVRESAELAGATTESIRNVSLIKSLGLETQEMQRLEDANTQILGLEIKKIKLIRILEFIQGTMINAMRVVIMATMFYLVYIQAISLGEFMTLFFYSFFVFSPLSQASELVRTYQEAKASSELVNELLNLPLEALPTHPQTLEQIKAIDFKGVHFGYSQDKHVVHAINVTIHAGQTVAFVGPSGSGKSTILKLLVGLYNPSQGSVLINGIALTSLDIQQFKKRVGIVAQDTQLFAGTIRQNLQFVKPSASDEECMQVLRYAAIDDIVFNNPAGLDTKIGEGGIKISGGQRQRLAIARALLRDPDILIFDEATSSLDSLVEQEITQTIKNISQYKPNLITILVAHRLSTIIHADNIYVLEKGHIIEQGSHVSLLQQSGLYSALRRQQSGQD